MTATITAEPGHMEKEQRLLNLICVIAALGLFAFVAYTVFAAGAVISTDGLFFIVVPMVIAICFLAVPLQPIVMRRVAKLLGTGDETVAPAPAVVGSKTAFGGTVVSAGRPPALKSWPALKDKKGRALPPDVNRMVAEMQRTEGSKQ
ncbi:MAG TPA: hypothetical protein VGP81_12220 [Pyrinomonadaceae bacterium]|jgi:hypothetical protein|nr:hypothetical protein [Pyrinomonadaceae bacterium]